MREDTETQNIYTLLTDLADVDTYDVNLRDHPKAWAAVEKFMQAQLAVSVGPGHQEMHSG